MIAIWVLLGVAVGVFATLAYQQWAGDREVDELLMSVKARFELYKGAGLTHRICAAREVAESARAYDDQDGAIRWSPRARLAAHQYINMVEDLEKKEGAA